ncbi:MAG: DUF192 domain-containing protein [Saprospiraceae bacterium]|nr:DUF192 domain-containing protein [Saprospiraceae bacterium]
MAKKSSNKKKAKIKSRPAPKPVQSPKQRRMGYLVLLLLLPIAGGIIYSTIPSKPKVGPQFIKEGELQFLLAERDSIVEEIDIEIADTPDTRTQGLMWRRSMEDNQGMLFIMEENEPQSFWMLNTYISLDIIYVNEHKEIVSIQANTTPQSTQSVPSGAAAKYVVEVNAGFAAEHGLEVGDRIDW